MTPNLKELSIPTSNNKVCSAECFRLPLPTECHYEECSDAECRGAYGTAHSETSLNEFHF